MRDPSQARDFGCGLPLLHPVTRKARVPGTPDALTPAKRLNFIGDALRDFLDPRSRIEAGL